MTLWRDMTVQQAKDAHAMFKLAKSLRKTNRAQEAVDPIVYIMGNGNIKIDMQAGSRTSDHADEGMRVVYSYEDYLSEKESGSTVSEIQSHMLSTVNTYIEKRRQGIDPLSGDPPHSNHDEDEEDIEYFCDCDPDEDCDCHSLYFDEEDERERGYSHYYLD